ncbi:hypothetical protein [Streptomyces termitum]|uniref:hypothetical protein n=1 Tax=Streptomyces termitum TaxID=67368 RepID=UPI0033A54B09
MPQHDPNGHHDPAADPRFTAELGSALRTAGEGFALDGRPELISAGLVRGRRRLLRRRLAVTGGALALAAVGIGGVYAGSVVTPDGAAAKASVAAPPTSEKPRGEKPPVEAGEPGGPRQAAIPIADIISALKASAPAGTWKFDQEDGVGQGVSGTFDDGRGEAAFFLSLSRAGGTGETGADMVTCPDKVYVPYDRCTDGRTANGSRVMVLQGYVYPDKREETKSWRATLLTKDGFLVDFSEHNAPAEKGAEVNRENPPLTATQLKELVAADAWKPLLDLIPPYVPPTGQPGGQPLPPPVPGVQGSAVTNALRSLLPKHLRVTDKGGEGEFGYVVVDDGKGKSLVQVNVQYGMGDSFGGAGEVTTLPDGRRVALSRQPGEKGGAGVVWWTADTVTPDGFRVVVSAFNTGAQHQDATRAEPALTMEQLKALALDPKWAKLPAKAER